MCMYVYVYIYIYIYTYIYANLLFCVYVLCMLFVSYVFKFILIIFGGAPRFIIRRVGS